MAGGLSLITAPAVDAIELDDVLNHLRVTQDQDKAQVQKLISSATTYQEDIERRAFITQTWDYFLDDFPGAFGHLEIPNPPLQSVTSITYIDQNEDSQTLAASKYIVDAVAEPGRIMPAIGESWPSTASKFNVVTIRFVAGYGNNPASVPDKTKHALRLLVGHWFENREATGASQKQIEFGVGNLSERVHTF